MKNDYLIVHKSILPEYYYQVIAARELILSGKYSVSDGCKEVGISRGTYYKYKDYVFKPTESFGKRALLGFHLMDEKGVLSNLLNAIANTNGKIISINQEMPMNKKAYVTIAINIIDVEMTTEEFVNSLEKINGVINVELIAVE